MSKERNKQIACLVLQGRSCASVGIEYGISRTRVYQITRRVVKLAAREFIGERYSVRELRKSGDELIKRINEMG